MGNYLTHTIGSSPLGLRPFIGLEVLDGILKDLTSKADKQETVNEAIEGAESTIDTFLAERYTVPVTDATALEVLENATGILSVEALYARGRTVPELVTKRADSIRKWLEAVSKGIATLPGATPSDEIADGSDAILTSTETRLANRTDLSGW